MTDTTVRYAAPLLVMWAVVAVEPRSAHTASPPDPPDLQGTWAQKIVMTSLSDPPVIGEVTSRTITYALYEVTQERRDLEVRTETCDVKLRNESSMMSTLLPDRFVRALPDEERSARIADTDDGPVLEFERSYTVLGARLREPRSETLPSSPDDPRVIDDDGDNHPGVTIQVEGIVDGALRVVQRAWDRYRAPVESTSRVAGTVEWRVDQHVVDATSVFLQGQPPTRPHPDESKSHFEMVRVSSDFDCSEVLDRRNDLFDTSH